MKALAFAFDAVLIAGLIVFAVVLVPLAYLGSLVIVAFDGTVRALFRAAGEDFDRP